MTKWSMLNSKMWNMNRLNVLHAYKHGNVNRLHVLHLKRYTSFKIEYE